MDAPEFSSLKILLLGGKSHGLATLRAALAVAGVSRIVQVEESQRALELLSLERFDVVFFDLTAAPINGQSFAVAARRTPTVFNPMVPIFLLQERVSRHDVEKIRDMGATDVMTCPLSPQTVMTKLRTALVSPRPFIAAPEFFGPDRRAKARPNFPGPERRVRVARKARLVMPEKGGKPEKPVLL